MKKIAFKDGKFSSMYEETPDVKIYPLGTDDVFECSEELAKEILQNPSKAVLVEGKIVVKK